MLIKTIKSNNIDGLQWLCCPNCGAKTKIGVYFETTLVIFPLYCSRCKTETIISGRNYNMMLNKEVHKEYMKTRKPVEEVEQEPEFANTD